MDGLKLKQVGGTDSLQTLEGGVSGSGGAQRQSLLSMRKNVTGYMLGFLNAVDAHTLRKSKNIKLSEALQATSGFDDALDRDLLADVQQRAPYFGVQPLGERQVWFDVCLQHIRQIKNQASKKTALALLRPTLKRFRGDGQWLVNFKAFHGVINQEKGDKQRYDQLIELLGEIDESIDPAHRCEALKRIAQSAEAFTDPSYGAILTGMVEAKLKEVDAVRVPFWTGVTGARPLR